MRRSVLSRRAFLTGNTNLEPSAHEDSHCISSAVVTLLPGREEEVVARLTALQGAEVCDRKENKMVLLLEGPTSGAVGGLLAEIAVMEGVVSANMVFEHTEREISKGSTL